jgi:hypothetical protein
MLVAMVLIESELESKLKRKEVMRSEKSANVESLFMITFSTLCSNK